MFIQISGILGGREDSSLQLRRKQISRTRPSLYKIRPLSLSLSLSSSFSFPRRVLVVENALVDPSNTSISRVEIEGGAQTSIPRNKRKRYCRGGVTNSFHLAEDARHLLAPLHLYRDIEDPCEKLPMDVSFCPFPSSLSQNPSVSFIWRPVSSLSHP